MREMILNALKTKLIGKMNGHIANIEVMLANPIASGNNPNIMYNVEKEITALQELNGKLNILSRYFEAKPTTEENTKQIKNK